MVLVLKILVSLIFVVAAVQKFNGRVAEGWARWGYSRQFRVATGIAELVAVALLWWPGLTLVGAALMGLILLGALATLIRYHEAVSRRLLPVLSLVMILAILYLSYPNLSYPTPTSQPQRPNPASVFCEQHGGKLVFRPDASGGVAGMCVFTDGSECDEWAYFQGTCGPAR